ncbi:unnamed protein product [Rangifer tarandus platyrhynchus]|uniref:Uncharacterized protein n=1 Tax=Rangifer tarandus platyrhynchus TaxID=3082113 RepID=A0AC60A740_RANTA
MLVYNLQVESLPCEKILGLQAQETASQVVLGDCPTEAGEEVRPHHKEANELLSGASSEGCNDSVRSTGARGSGRLAPPVRDG